MRTPIESFIADLPLAFPIAYPPDMRFSECQCGECGEIRRDFEGLDWKSVPEAILKKHAWHIGLLGPSAIRYFFPAFLRSSVVHPDAMATEIIDELRPSGFTTSEVSKFTDDQRKMIIRYLDFFSSDDGEPSDEDPADKRWHKRWLKIRARWAPE